jgi:hypothetical protein
MMLGIFAARPGGRFRSSALLGALVSLALVDCKSDHDALVRRPNGVGASGAGSAGTAGASGTAGSSSGGSGGLGGSSAATGGSGGMKVVEPQGRSVMTLVHGVVDAERVAWCFARGTGDRADFVGRPEPDAGLGYGEAFTFETLDDIDLDDDDVSVYALTGELELVSDLACDEAVERAREEMALVEPRGSGASGGRSGEGGEGGGAAHPGAGGEAGEVSKGGESGAPAVAGAAGDDGGPDVGGAGAAGQAGAGSSGPPELPEPARLRVAPLAAFPRGTLAEGYSLLMVAAGCIGGSAFADAGDKDICGDDYVPRAGNLTAELVVLSRTTSPSALVLQALHASRASGERGVRVVPPADAVLPAVTIADRISEGTLRPREPRIDLGPDDFGIDTRDFAVQVNDNGSPLFDERWPAILSRSGIDEPEIGRGYTLVLIGPSSEIRARGWWNEPAFTLVDNDPGG